MKRTRLHPGEWDYSRQAAFAQGVDVDGLVFVSGMVGLDDEGALVGADGDMRAQALQTFRNIEKVLAEADMSLNDIVKINCYVTDGSKYHDYAAVRAELFTGNLPASATVIVAGLVVPGALLEIDAVAIKGSGNA